MNEQILMLLEGELREIVSPKHLFGIWNVAIDGKLVQIGHIDIYSNDLSTFLGTSEQVVILAATLGTGVDIFLQKLMHTDIAKAVQADKLASKLVEDYISHVQAKMGLEGKRYSPGYGDFDIKHQRDMLKILGCDRIGLHMTDSCMLTPSKSITAIVKKE